MAVDRPVTTRYFNRSVFELSQGVVQDILHQSGFSRSAYTCDAHKPAKRYTHVNVFEVVLICAEDNDSRVFTVGHLRPLFFAACANLPPVSSIFSFRVPAGNKYAFFP